MPTTDEPWDIPHQLTVQRQIRQRSGPTDEHGQRWLEAEPTGLAIALCNCGLNTGWIPATQLPSREQLEDDDQHASLMDDDLTSLRPAEPGIPRCTATWQTERHGLTNCWRAADHTERDGFELHLGETELGYRFQWIGTEPGATTAA
jgi:hypothetical protein